jgi:hypothetical protein
MSDLPADDRDRIDLRSILAEIDRKRAETQKRQEETQKFVAAQHQLMAEGKKFNRDPWMLIAGAFTRLPEILHALGIGP